MDYGRLKRSEWVMLFLMFGGLFSLIISPVYAAVPTAASKEIAWGFMIMKLLGGLSLFLFGMEQMSEALKAVAGNRMKDILGKLTSNRLAGLVTGAGVTAVIQSSSVTTVMLVGFVTAGLMSLSQAIGVILGADIGTTITAQIVAFPVKKYALLLITVGFGMLFIGRKEHIKQYGILIMGLGMIFFGMGVMSDAMKPMRSYQPFINLMQSVSNPVIGILLSTAFTALVQSSSATMGVVIVLASQGMINLDGGIALALGANIGTCATAGLASIGKPREAVRVAVAHVTFKIVGVALIFFFIPYLSELAVWMSPQYPELSGVERLAKETPRQVANAHTMFNVGIAFLFLPFSTVFARFCEWIVPDKAESEAEIPDEYKPQFLNDVLIDTPVLALGMARHEIGRIGIQVATMFDRVVPAFMDGNQQDLEEIVGMDDEVDAVHGQVVVYLGKLSMTNIPEEQAAELVYLLQTVNRFENIGDIIGDNMATLGSKRMEEGIVVSEATQKVLGNYHSQVSEALKRTAGLIVSGDMGASAEINAMRKEMVAIRMEAAEHEIERLTADAPNRLRTYTLEREIIDHMNDIYRICRRIARSMPRTLSDSAEPAEPSASAPQPGSEFDVKHSDDGRISSPTDG